MLLANTSKLPYWISLDKRRYETMLTAAPFSWLSQTANGENHTTATAPAISRRRFTNSSLAATALAALPARSLWADASKPSIIPAQLNAVGLTGKPVSLAGSDI
jgi:hypothetical protein